jgi:uncharacterized protein
MQNKIMYYLDKVHKLESGIFVPPITCEIDPSNRCPLQCKFCMFAGSNKHSNEDLPLRLYGDLINQLLSLDVRSITFTGGGEPLMNKRYDEMARCAFSLGFQVGLITNGVLADQRLGYVDRYKFIRISLNAGNSYDYYNITGKDLFGRVVNNTKDLIKRGGFVGWSYVVFPENKSSIKEAQRLAEEVGVQYIQFKPAWINGKPYNDYEVNGEKVIDTRRYHAYDNLPCSIAGLIGIVGADGHLYYCCQYRGDKRFDLGALKHNNFRHLWEKRLKMKPDVSKCPHCRYMNYARAYQEMMLNADIFFDHKDFL